MSINNGGNSTRENLVISKRAAGWGIVGLALAVAINIAERVHDHRQQVEVDQRIKQALTIKFDTPQRIDEIPGTPLSIVDDFPGQPIVYRMSGGEESFMRPPTSGELRDAIISTANEPAATLPEVHQ